MQDQLGPLEAERRFFAALVDANSTALDQVLADDFLLIDVIRGDEITKAALLAVIGSGQLKFEAIDPADSRVRLYQSAAVITGRTRMSGRFGGTPFSAHSRYTHVFIEQQGQWRMVAAQGTQIKTD